MINVRPLVRPGGFLDLWLRFTEPFEFADSYSLFSILAAGSAAINGRLVINPDTEPCVKSNIYVLLYGPPGARKGPPMRFAVEALAEAVPETPRLPRSFTMERLTSLLAEESDEKGRCGGLIYTEEFHRLIGGKDYQLDNLAFLSELWDCPPDYLRSTQKREDELILQPYVTGLWASNPDWVESVDPRVLSGGALRRMLTINEYGPKLDDVTSPKKDMGLFSEAVLLLRERVGTRAFKPVSMLLTPAALDVMDRWYRTEVKELRRTSDSRLTYFASCLQAHALKLAAVIHILEGGVPHLLSAESMAEGMALAMALVPGTADLYASLVPTPYAKLRTGILRAVAASGVAGLSPEELDRMIISAQGVKPRDVAEARIAMVRDGTIKLTEGRYHV